jgi:hypothetical protein
MHIRPPGAVDLARGGEQRPGNCLDAVFNDLACAIRSSN